MNKRYKQSHQSANSMSEINPIAELLDPKFDKPRRWIDAKRQHGVSWKDIEDHPTLDNIEVFLLTRQEEDYWPEMTSVMWKALVSQQQEAELEVMSIDAHSGQALVVDGSSNNTVDIPTNPHSCWQLYRKRLAEEKEFPEKTIGEIERATLKLLRRLSSNTRETGPIKGLVIGNVQSGKTANMAALMAMASDWGWNMFIVLSGTIDNLRIQTQDRLMEDLNSEGCNLSWYCLEHPAPTAPIGSRAQDLHFEDGARQRYFSVSLKNASRLKKLIQWLQKDRNKQGQMKILVIDDEADQAGINTANVDSSERKKINKLICALANGKNEKAQEIDGRYLAMNYIGYTATPYANILNESGRESLYPRNFISTLSVSKEYFGPQQIFGIHDGLYDGLDIVREVPVEELDLIKDIHNGIVQEMPDSLADSICWFICGVAAMRQGGYRKPVSMLVHTSQKVIHHGYISALIQDWINSADRDALLDRCRKVWESETSQFSLQEFKDQYLDYGRMDSVSDYPSFEDVKEGIREIISVELKPIMLSEQGETQYHNGIHLCVDNSANNGVNDEDEYLRLVYPKKENMPEKAPAFLVIGGATLSRGLTLEGLISTFFLRSVKQADTLMQMGRWFGYRRGYELIPRIWLTETAKAQFDFLSSLDQELRDEIHMMEVAGLKPDEYAARVKNTPKLQLIRITAKNRMQKSVEAEMDFRGSFNQTYLFDDDHDTLEGNLELTKDFISQLGSPRQHKACNTHSSNTCIWDNVPFEKVDAFLRAFRFCSNLTVFSDMEPLLSWVKQITEEGNLSTWNIVLAGKKNASPEEMCGLPGCNVSKVSRTRKKTENEIHNVINIGVLRAPTDILADVDLEDQPQEIKDMFTHIDETKVKEIRAQAGLEKTPQLLMYVVDKDSKAKEGSSSRKDLEAPCDIVGLCVNIPGGAMGANYIAKVMVQLDNEFNDEGDLEGSNN